MIITCQQYNAIDLKKWHERVEEWKKDKFTQNIIPQIAFVGFRNQYTGEMKNYGFVSYGKNSDHWFKTKKEAIEYERKEES